MISTDRSIIDGPEEIHFEFEEIVVGNVPFSLRHYSFENDEQVEGVASTNAVKTSSLRDFSPLNE